MGDLRGRDGPHGKCPSFMWVEGFGGVRKVVICFWLDILQTSEGVMEDVHIECGRRWSDLLWSGAQGGDVATQPFREIRNEAEELT